MGSMSPEQVLEYEEQGYVVLPGVLSDGEMQRFRDRAREISLGAVPEEARNRVVRDIAFARGHLPLPEDPEHAVWKIINPDRFDPLFAEALRFPKVLDAVSSLIGEDILAFLLMFIYKPPGVPGSEHPFHQDALYFPFGPQRDCVGVWIPLDPVNEANGSLTVVPGSHRMKVQTHEMKDGINFGALAARGVEGNPEFHERAVSLDLPAGDCVLFSTRMLHRTGGNRTDGHRRVITLHMASARCRPATDHPLEEYGFTSVRGETFPGCLQPQENPDLALATGRGRAMDRS
jgi:phytanoyl-CoA hydroxylase